MYLQWWRFYENHLLLRIFVLQKSLWNIEILCIATSQQWDTSLQRRKNSQEILSGTIKTERSDQKIEVSILANFMALFFSHD